MKLTIGIRDGIINQEVRNKFHDKEFEAENKFNKAVEDEVIKKIKKSKVDVPQNLIDLGFVYTSNTAKIKGLDDSRYGFYHDLGNYYPITRSDGSFRLETTAKITKAYANLKKVRDEECKFRKELRSILYSFTTDTQVVKHLPELKSYFTDSISTAIIPIEQINNMRKQLKKSNG